MPQNEGTLIIAPIRPSSSEDIFASVFANEAKGGFHTAIDIASMYAIPSSRREIGMLCYVIEENKFYQLAEGISNLNWFDAEFSATSAVTSVNTLTGDVLLTTNDISETVSRVYFNRNRFLEQLRTTSIAELFDVEIDSTLLPGNGLFWNATKQKFTPSSPAFYLTLNDLTDVQVSIDFPPTSINDPVRKNVTTIDGQGNITVTQADTDLVYYNRSWGLGWFDSENRWTVKTHRSIFQRMLLGDLQDMGFSYATIETGQTLQWDGELNKFVAGAIVNINTSDDIPEGEINLYLLPNNLRSVSNAHLEIGHLKNVDDSLIGMTALSHPSAIVLGWSPSNNRWQGTTVLTDSITTANVPEPNSFTGNDPPWNKSEMNPNKRFYFTGERVKNALGLYGDLSWFKDVNYPYGLTHGKVLAWNGTVNQWQPGIDNTALFTTSDLPEGSNLYYTSERVRAWAYSNIRPTINYHEDVSYSNPQVGQGLVWDGERWTQGYAMPFPEVGVEGQYLRVDYTAPDKVSWQDKDPNYLAQVQYSDLPRQLYTTSQDLKDTFTFLGTLQNQVPVTSFQNPVSLGLVAIADLSGNDLSFLCDRIYYANALSIGNPIVMDPDADFVEISNGGIIVDLKDPSAYRVEEIAFQARVTGDHRYKISTSKDGISWTDITSFEIGEEMLFNALIGLNSEIVTADLSLENRFFYLITTPWKNQQFTTGSSLDSAFYRYVKIELETTINSGTVELYELDFYGYYNSGIMSHEIIGLDNGKFLLSGVNNLEFLVPGITNTLNNSKIEQGFQCWIISDVGHTIKFYTNGIGRIYNSINTSNTPTLNEPILIPPKTFVNLVYIGYLDEITSEGPPIQTTKVHKWWLSVGSGLGGSGGGSGSDDTFLLNRANHFGTQSVSTITGLATVATTGSYNSLTNQPSLKTVATTGNYNDLTNKPTLGTASSKDAGTGVGNVLLLAESNKLPALDGSLLTNLPTGGTGTFNSPMTTKGDLIIRGVDEAERLPVGLNGYVLLADSTSSTGVRWGSVSGAGTDALTLNSQPDTYYLDRSNHVGEIPVGAITGLALVATTNSYNSLLNLPTLGSASSKNAGTGANEVLLLAEDNKLPALDGSLLTGINSPLTTKGDIIVRANGVDVRLPVGSDNQVLAVDSSAPAGVIWKNPESTSNSSLLNGETGTYYLDRTNHTGTQSASTISGLSTVATTGSYTDLLNRPTLSTVASTGSFNDLLNKPVLGTASQFNVGTGSFNIIQLTATGQLPDILKSQLTSTTVNEGDLIVRGAIADINLAVGTQGQFLTVDTAVSGKLKWTTLDIPEPILPTTNKGDLISHNGTDSAILPIGIDKQILSVDLLSPTGLKWIDNIANADNAGNANLLEGQDGTYYLDRTNHTGTQSVSTITGLSAVAISASYNDLLDIPTIGTVAQFDVGVNAGNIPQLDNNGLLSTTIIPFPEDITSAEGDLVVRGAVEKIALPIGADGFVLTVDSLVPGKVKWASPPDPSTNLPTTAKGDLISHNGTESAILPLGLDKQILSVDFLSPTGLKWIDNIANADNAGNADLLEGQNGAYYLDRTNHTGTQSVSTITGLSAIAVSGSYDDLINSPTLGTASTKNAGTGADEVLLLAEEGKLPILDGSLLTGVASSPTILVIDSPTTLSRHALQILCVSAITSFSITFPSTPQEGDRILIVDDLGSDPTTPTGFGNNPITLLPNTGHSLQGHTNIILDDENTSVGFVYQDNRWSIYSCQY